MSTFKSGKYTLEKVRKNQVEKEIRANGIFRGFMCGNNVNPLHISDGWRLGVPVELESIETFNIISENMEYALKSERTLGGTVAYYKILTEN